MAALNVGQVMTTGFADNGICVPAAAGEREYALVPFFDSPVPNAQTTFTVAGVGVKTTVPAALGALRGRGLSAEVRGDSWLTNVYRQTIQGRWL